MLSAEEYAPNLTESTEISPSSKSPERETHQTEEACELVKSSGVRGEIQVRDFLVTTSTETLPVLSPGTVSTILDESLETGNEYGQPPVLHPFDVTPPVEAAYATQDVSALTPVQSQIVSQSAPSFQSSPQSRTPTTNTQTQQYFSLAPNRVGTDSLLLESLEVAPTTHAMSTTRSQSSLKNRAVFPIRGRQQS